MVSTATLHQRASEDLRKFCFKTIYIRQSVNVIALHCGRNFKNVVFNFILIFFFEKKIKKLFTLNSECTKKLCAACLVFNVHEQIACYELMNSVLHAAHFQFIVANRDKTLTCLYKALVYNTVVWALFCLNVAQAVTRITCSREIRLARHVCWHVLSIKRCTHVKMHKYCKKHAKSCNKSIQRLLT